MEGKGKGDKAKSGQEEGSCKFNEARRADSSQLHSRTTSGQLNCFPYQRPGGCNKDQCTFGTCVRALHGRSQLWNLHNTPRTVTRRILRSSDRHGVSSRCEGRHHTLRGDVCLWVVNLNWSKVPEVSLAELCHRGVYPRHQARVRLIKHATVHR